MVKIKKNGYIIEFCSNIVHVFLALHTVYWATILIISHLPIYMELFLRNLETIPGIKVSKFWIIFGKEVVAKKS